ncbi:MAG: molybdate ABC transporter substrate-binding protein [Magnetococcales bacterium]|nr:molybdate ABC transporter substrate-binding protein [Magnetococcales bacterium]
MFVSIAHLAPEEFRSVIARIPLLLMLIASPALADEIHVAVAANFTAPAKAISADFEKETGHQVILSFGATGKFYAQIKNGAPFEVLLAADSDTPAKLEQDGAAVPGSRFTYAIGQLVLWSSKPGVVDPAGAILKEKSFNHLAIADPKLAPYGAAAWETLTALGLLEAVKSRLVQAENIAQAHQFVASGNAELGFVALSQILKNNQIIDGSAWRVPEHLYKPIRQDAVLLNKGEGKAPVLSWLNHLKSKKGQTVMRSFGYL